MSVGRYEGMKKCEHACRVRGYKKNRNKKIENINLNTFRSCFSHWYVVVVYRKCTCLFTCLVEGRMCTQLKLWRCHVAGALIYIYIVIYINVFMYWLEKNVHRHSVNSEFQITDTYGKVK